jgi:PAS domain S-box-containing protein
MTQLSTKELLMENAKKHLAKTPALPALPDSRDELLYNLEVHKIELEIQNEELRIAQSALQESHDRYLNLYEFSPIGYLTLTGEGLIAEINLTGVRILGVERHKLINQCFAGLVMPKDRDYWHIQFMRLRQYEPVDSLELSFQRSDHSPCNVRINCLLVAPNDKDLLVRINFTDITENKQLEEALGRLQKIASRVPGVVYQFCLRPDGSSHFPYASEGIKDIYRLSPEEVCEDASKVFALIHPEDYGSVVASIEQSAQNLMPWKHEYRVRFDDGTVHWLLGNAIPERKADNSTLWHGFITNITERKALEQQLLELNHFNVSIINSLDSHIAVLDAQGDIIAVNKAWREFGKENNLPKNCQNSKESHYMDDCHYYDLMSQADGDCENTARTGIAAVLAGELKVFNLEYTLHIRNQQCWYHMSVLPLQNLQGGVVISHKNITERKQMEKALSESEFRWKFALEGSGDGVWDWNIQNHQSNYSPRWKEMLGYTEDEILPTHQEWLKRIHPDDQLSVAKALQAYLDGKTIIYRIEYRLRCKDGNYKWILSRGMLVSHSEDGKPLRMIGTNTDISAIKQIQITLQEKEQMLCHSQRIAHIGSWSLNLATGYLNWSDEMYLIFGVSPESFKHNRAALNDLILAEDHALRNSWFSDCLKGIEMYEIVYRNDLILPEDLILRNNSWLSDCEEGITMHEVIFRIRLPDGRIRFISSNGQLQYDTINKVLCLVGSTQDITARKNREQQDREHLHQLAHVTRLGLMGEMASGIAHEVNQPLTAIATYAQVSLNMMQNENPDMSKLAEVIYKTQQQALRAGQIIHRMREFIKPNTKQMATTQLNTVINEAANLCLSELTHKNISLSLELQENLPPVSIDAIQIEQVIINLIRNSADALENCPENQPRKLSIESCLTVDNDLEVRIKDNGPGIDDDQRQKVLMPFYTTKAEGMGMGLSISQSIIEAHNGTLYFNSNPGKGCTFYFTLPVPLPA